MSHSAAQGDSAGPDRGGGGLIHARRSSIQGPFSSRGASRTLLHICLDRVLRGRGYTYLDDLTPLYMFRHVSPGQPDVREQGGRGIW